MGGITSILDEHPIGEVAFGKSSVVDEERSCFLAVGMSRTQKTQWEPLSRHAKVSTGDPASDKRPITLIIFSRPGRRNRRVIFHKVTQSGLTRLM